MAKKEMFFKSSFFINTLVILITGFIIKLLGLINRIFITRLLGTSGMSLYILSFPTIMLFISISGLSLNVTISKLVAENIKVHKLSPKILLKKAIFLSFIVSIFTILIFLAILSPLVHTFLKNDNLYIPLLSTIFLIPLVGISDALKGYFNGLKKMNFSSTANLIEQIARIIFSIGFLYIMLPHGYVIATFFCLLAMSIGELSSIIFSLIKIKKIKCIHYENTSGEMKAILKMSIPSTLSRLIGNFTYFLEPIVFVWILTYLHYDHAIIEETYTIVNAYTLSLLTLGSFVSIALATTVVPSVSESFIVNNMKQVHYYIKKTLIFSLVPGIFITVILFFYPTELMDIVYGTTQGAKEVRLFAFFFLPYYMQAPLSSIYQALGKSKDLFITSSIFNFLRLLLIIVLSFIPTINLQSLIIATFLTLDGFFILIYHKIKKLTSFKISYIQSLNLLIVFLLGVFLAILFTKTSVNVFISILLLFVIYLFVCVKLKLIDIASLHIKKTNDS